MSLKIEKLEKGMAKLTIEVSAEEFDKAYAQAYKKNVTKINMPGFRTAGPVHITTFPVSARAKHREE